MKKRSIKKVLALGLAGAMLCGMLTACGGANGSSSAPSASSEGQAEPAAPETEKEKVVLWHLWTGVEAGYLDDAVAAYNAQSDKYYVEALSVPDSQKIMVAIQSGDGPDITDDFTNNIGAYASKGIMLPLDDYIAKNNTDLSDIIPSTLEACKYEGKTYALPAGMNLMALFYNKTLLAEAGYAEPCPIETLAQLCNMSVSTLRRKFYSALECAPSDYIHRVRIGAATVMLSAENKSILEICHQVGYMSLSSFNRQFRKLTGESPREMRNRMRKKQTSPLPE